MGTPEPAPRASLESVPPGRPYSPYDYQPCPAGPNQSFRPKSPASSSSSSAFLPTAQGPPGPQQPPASLPGLTAQPQLPPKEVASDPSRTPEEEPLNLEGLVAHRVAGKQGPSVQGASFFPLWSWLVLVGAGAGPAIMPCRRCFGVGKRLSGAIPSCIRCLLGSKPGIEIQRSI